MIFSVLGFMAQRQQVPVSKVVESGMRLYRLVANSQLKHATFLSHRRQPDVCSFPISLDFTPPHLYCSVSFQ